MENLSLKDMQEMQKVLQEKYLDKWGGLSPEKAMSKMLWMIAEVGEAAQIIKKKGNSEIMSDAETRKYFVEEMCDVLMYFNDVLISYSITPEEFERAYTEKHNKNMKRW